MHAIVCRRHGPPEVMQYEEAPPPQARPGEVVIRAEAIVNDRRAVIETTARTNRPSLALMRMVDKSWPRGWM